MLIIYLLKWWQIREKILGDKVMMTMCLRLLNYHKQQCALSLAKWS